MNNKPIVVNYIRSPSTSKPISPTINNNEIGEYCFTNLTIEIQTESNEQTVCKFCSVCGDKALGYNFGAITCESCKAFFRRNAYKTNKISCLFNETCEVTVNTRRFCAPCRLKKCFQVKMKKESIIVHKEKKKQARLNEKYFPYKNNMCETDKIETIKVDCNSTVSLSSNDCQGSLNEIQIMPSSSSDENESNNQPHSDNPTVIMSVLKKSKLVSINDKLSREGLARLLSEEEWETLFYVHKAYVDNFFESGSMSPIAIENANLISLVNSSGFLVRKLINFAKCLSEFTSLDQSCQIALLKGAVLNSLILRSAVEYNIEKNVWVTPQGEISSDIIKSAGLLELQEDYSKYCRSFKKLLGSDKILISLTQILCLFSSDNLSLTDRQFVSDIHDKYIILLKHYLESSYGFVESRSIFVWIFNNLTDLQSLTAKHGEILLHIDPTNVDPLMLEVYDMNLSNIITKNY